MGRPGGGFPTSTPSSLTTGRRFQFTPNDEQRPAQNLHNLNLPLRRGSLASPRSRPGAPDQCLFVKNFTAVLIAHTLPDAKKIFRNKVRRVYDALPDAIKGAVPAGEGGG